MGRKQWERLSQLFEEASNLPTADRAEFLDRSCADDRELRAELESMLREHDRGTTGILAQAPAGVASATGRLGPGDVVGRYRLLRLIGQGGMGAVFEAAQENPRRVVALKVLRPGLWSHELVQRFRREAQVLGQLQHAGIAHVLEAGSVGEGRDEQPFLAMELIRGQPLVDYATAHDLDIASRLELMARICDAVDHAHQRGIVHRDLKPGNILVDDDGQPKVLDFGVARARLGDSPFTTLHTSAGQLLGTLAYMSPEQVSGNPAAVDAPSDIYSLGVILFELLSQRLPVDVASASIPQAVRLIQEHEPTRLGSINTSLRGDVETIVAKAMEKDARRRYASAAALAQDIRRHLRDEPILARPASAMYQFRKFARRNRALVGGTAATFLALVGGTIASTWLAIREADQRQLATHRSELATALAYRSRILAAQAALQVHDFALADRSLHDAPPQLQAWEWRHLRWLTDQSMLATRAHEDAVRFVAWSDDDRSIITVGTDGFVRLLNPSSGEPTISIRPADGGIRAARLGPDGRTLLVHEADAVSAWNARTGEQLWRRPGQHSRFVRPFHPDGSLIALCEHGSFTLTLVDAGTGQTTRSLRLEEPSPAVIGFSADGSIVVLWQALASDVLAMELAGGAPLWRRRCSDARPCGNSAVAITHRADVEILDVTTGKPIAGATGIDEVIGDFDYSAALARLVVVRQRGHIALFDAFTGQMPAVVPGRVGAFSGDGLRLVTAGEDGMVRVWDAALCSGVVIVPGNGDSTLAADASRDGRLVVTTGWGSVRIWNALSGQELWTRIVSRRGLPVVALDPTCRRVAASTDTGEVLIIDVPPGAWPSESRQPGEAEQAGDGGVDRKWHDSSPARAVWPPGPPLKSLHWMDDRRLLTLRADGSLRVILADAVATTSNDLAVVEQVAGVTLTADGRLAAVAAADGRMFQLLDTSTWRPIRSLSVEAGGAALAAFSVDAKRLAGVIGDGRVLLWNVADGRLLREFAHANAPIRSLAFTADGLRLVVGCADGSVRLWDPAAGDEIVVFTTAGLVPTTLRATDDGTILASGGDVVVQRLETAPPAGGFLARSQARTARFIVDRLFAELEFADDVVNRLHELAPAYGSAAEMAVRIARARGDQPNVLNSAAWGTVRLPDRPPAEYERALRRSERACHLWPDDHAMLNTLAAAQCRTANLELALRTLDRCDELSRRHTGAVSPIDAVFRAMVLARFGRTDEAEAFLTLAGDLARDLDAGDRQEIHTLLREAESLVRPGREQSMSSP